ncbi:MFS transporter [Streptomyces sp. NPDC007088]|uniref:MFS transporter n=1 Tax=Streptomyces sp. NPDC007088 TaxID=3364773 RepID=UPI0036CD8B2F
MTTASTTQPPPHAYLVVAGVFAVGMAGTTLPTPLYGLYREEIGFSQLIVTVVFAVYALGVIAVLLLAGNYSDLAGRRATVRWGLVLSVASALCFVFEGGLPALFAGRLLSGFAAGLFSGAATAYVLDLAPPHKTRAGLAATAANMGGLGCGPLLAGLLAQYAPWPLRLPYLVHLGLLLLAGLAVQLLPEPLPGADPRSAPHPEGMAVPAEVRRVFVPAACAAFSGFSLLGLFTAVSPSFLTETLGQRNLAVVGLVVFLVFLGSIAGQSALGRLGVRRALPTGCFLLVAALLMVAAGLAFELLPLLVVGGVTGGVGQGLAFRAGTTAIGAKTPEDRRGATLSAYFVVAYVGISVPVVAVGALARAVGLKDAGLLFSACVLVLAAVAGGYLLRPRVGATLPR